MVVLNVFHVLIAIAMVALVLVQRGAGATAGAAFGSGASGTVFGARGAGTFLTKSTWVLAALFCAISLTMAVIVSHHDTSTEANLGVVSSAPVAPQETVPVPASPSQNATEDSQQGDLPTVQISEDASGSAAARPAQAADDLPALDDGKVESTESSQGAAGTGKGSDDS
jgi:preprotein translocase subunit SecG